MSGLRMMIAVMAVLGAAFSTGQRVEAAPYAAFVMDARTGAVLHESDADRRLHPASLTKMMTLYLTFEAVKAGRLGLDQRVTISRHVAAKPASKMGYRAGQKVRIRDLIRAAAIKSANDAAAALAEAVGGSESAFADIMTRRARELGMANTRFLNASGLTQSGQYSTARDMAILGRALFYDHPQYYNLFSRITTPASGRTIYNTNRRFLNAYRGADGIKTGYTSAAGFNLVASAERGQERIIAVVFGGKSTPWRNKRAAELLDLGFGKAPSEAEYISTAALIRRVGSGGGENRVASASTAARAVAAAAPEESPPPPARPGDERAASASLLAQAGEMLVPSAAASETPPQEYTRLSPRRSPWPRIRPGSELAVAPAPIPREDAVSDWSVQLGIFAKEETAIAELASAALGVRGLAAAGRDVDQFTLSGRPAWRAQLTGFDRPGALAACAAIQAQGKDCVPVESAGR
ncbi:MAG: D-alanyl-D-alanine carboxypeptidase family protein [Pikeienuella sp.]|uniref:D-alanyl-D-alanine carboxypeptidase family protein n=1 Tax=Pikeienuella sp. TaxID=2831957 RepID=UPI00391A50E8